MLDAREVARHLVRMGYCPDAPEESVLLCPLRLQKLLYYCQGWGLALLGEPLFRQPLEAWPKGPVVADVYHQHAGKRDGITTEQAGEPSVELPVAAQALVGMVWREYSRFTPSELVTMTHAEPAWKEARGGLSDDAKSSNALSLDTMRAYFSEQARKSVPAGQFPTANPADVWQADAEFEKAGGRGVPLREAIRRAKGARQ
jgi:uncharacterized phage-associated protein